MYPTHSLSTLALMAKWIDRHAGAQNGVTDAEVEVSVSRAAQNMKKRHGAERVGKGQYADGHEGP